MIAADRPLARLPGWVLGTAGVAVVLVVFELAARLELLPARWFPPPSEILRALADEAVTAEFWKTVWATLRGWAMGLGIAALVAIPVGMLIGAIPFLYRQVRVVIEFLRPIPSVALIPVAVLLFGTGFGGKVFLASFAATWPLLFQSMYGVQDVDPVARDTARAYRLGRVRQALFVTLPSAAPYIATGLRVSSAVALILVVTGELVIGSAGVGNAIAVARSGGDVAVAYGYIAVAGLLGLALNTLFKIVERPVLHWHPGQRR